MRYSRSKAFEGFRYTVSWIIIRIFLFNIMIGGIGIFQILYGTAATISPGVRLPELDKIADFLSAFITFLSVIVVALSVYVRTTPSSPDPGSKYFSAWFIILLCLIGIYFTVTNGSVPNNILNGFALLGLAGSLFRIQHNPQRAADSF